MKIPRTTGVVLLCAIIVSSFSPKPINTKEQSPAGPLRNKYRQTDRSWTIPFLQGQRSNKLAMAFDFYLSITNYWQANVIVNWVSFNDPGDHASGDFPLYPGDWGYAQDSQFGSVIFVNISLPGPPEDPEAVRTLWYYAGAGFPGAYCQTITTSGTYGFYGVPYSAGAYLTVDTGGCL